MTPRTGTRSPWSSKATDILRRCALAVERVERVLVYEFAAFPSADEQVAAVEHSCMTR